MPSHKIVFQMTEYQLARILKTIKFLDPTYQPSSIHQMVKLVAIDYCAKLNIGRSDVIPPEIWPELKKLLPENRPKPVKSTDQELASLLGTLTNQYMQSNQVPQTTIINPITQQLKQHAHLSEEEQLYKNAAHAKQFKSLKYPEQSEPIKQMQPIQSPLTEDQPTESIKTTVDDFAFLKSLSEGEFE